MSTTIIDLIPKKNDKNRWIRITYRDKSCIKENFLSACDITNIPKKVSIPKGKTSFRKKLKTFMVNKLSTKPYCVTYYQNNISRDIFYNECPSIITLIGKIDEF